MNKHVIINAVIIMLLATANANVIADTGGSAYGFIKIEKVECKNKSDDDEKVVIKDIVNNSWDCEQAGLEIETGDKISIKITGIAQGFIPNPPESLVAAAVNDSVMLSWDIDANAISYNIYRTMTPGFVANESSLITNVADSPYEDIGLMRGITYYYLVTAISSSGESLPSVEISIVVPQLDNPPPPGGGGTTPPGAGGGGGNPNPPGPGMGGGGTPPPGDGGGGTTPPDAGGGGATPPDVGGGGTLPPPPPPGGGGNPNPPGAGMGGVGSPPPPAAGVGSPP